MTGEMTMGVLGVPRALLMLFYTAYLRRRLRSKESAGIEAFGATGGAHLTFKILTLSLFLYTGGLLLAGTVRILGLTWLFLPAKYVSAAGVLGFLFFLREPARTID